MNLEDLRKLEDLSRVTPNKPVDGFTMGKEYVVVKTSVGKMVINDNKIGIFLMLIEKNFDKVS